jgi:hypothetical protein
MGCDIHLVVEAKTDKGSWAAINTMNTVARLTAEGAGVTYVYPAAEDRNYTRFAALAGVRGEGPAPLGLPDDASETARFLCSEWGGDAHSHSYMPLAKAAIIFGATSEHSGEKIPSNYFFGVPVSSLGEREYRIVFWFDN